VIIRFTHPFFPPSPGKFYLIMLGLSSPVFCRYFFEKVCPRLITWPLPLDVARGFPLFYDLRLAGSFPPSFESVPCSTVLFRHAPRLTDEDFMMVLVTLLVYGLRSPFFPPSHLSPTSRIQCTRDSVFQRSADVVMSLCVYHGRAVRMNGISSLAEATCPIQRRRT